MGEKVTAETVIYLQRVMKVRHESAADIRETAEAVREEFLVAKQR